MESELHFEDYPFLKDLGLEKDNLGGFNGSKWVSSDSAVTSVNPHNGHKVATTKQVTAEEYEDTIKIMAANKKAWAKMPAPKRGEIVRQIGEAFRAKKEALGKLITLEVGKILSEGLGEVQEAIDMCDFACGLSRMIPGQVLPSEREDHIILENWNPVGIVGVITAFNFPCAVFAWNLMLSMICGNMTMWKPAPSTPLVTLATMKIILEVLEKNKCPAGVVTCVVGGKEIGEAVSKDKRVDLVSFTGSTFVGKIVSQTVTNRFGRVLLELGGNNATIIMDDANVELAVKGSLFGAAGTCGQRCTSLRRLLIHEKVYDKVKEMLLKAYPSIPIGDPLDSKTLVGPLHYKHGVKEYVDNLKKIEEQGGKIIYGGKTLEEKFPGGNYLLPTLVEIDQKTAPIVQHELFMPILYLIKIKDLDEAIELNNDVPQGLSSSLFTMNMQNVFKWVGPTGSDCGIVNVNIGTSGAEIGGAFGGEKETGGGRESGSDAWKQYMRRSTCTINYGDKLPLAQGVNFDV
jgi:aldehyde dehydrogenase family 7 protein A1